MKKREAWIKPRHKVVTALIRPIVALIAVDPDDAPALFAELQSCVPSAQCLGTVEEYKGGARIYLQ